MYYSKEMGFVQWLKTSLHLMKSLFLNYLTIMFSFVVATSMLRICS